MPDPADHDPEAAPPPPAASGPTTRVVRSGSPERTRELAGVLAGELGAGDVVVLSGELGAGKTVVVQGIAAALGVREPVTSPSFVLERQYRSGRVPLVHVDVYRLDSAREVVELGEDVLAPDVVTCIEWGDTVRSLLPDDRIEVELTLADAHDPDGVRELTLIGLGRLAGVPAVVAAAG